VRSFKGQLLITLVIGIPGIAAEIVKHDKVGKADRLIFLFMFGEMLKQDGKAYDALQIGIDQEVKE